MTPTVHDQPTDRPARWWALNPEGHGFLVCGECRAKTLDLTCSIPVLNEKPLCARCAGAVLAGEPPPYNSLMLWPLIAAGDPRWWSEWLCNCHFCDAQALGEAVQ